MSTAPKDAKAIFLEAIEKQDTAERNSFLNEACAGDIVLQRRVAELLASFDEAGGFMEDKPGAAFLPNVTRKPVTEGLATIIGPTSEEGLGTVIGPYKLLQQIGEGGFGTVYMAEQAKPVRRQVALKIIKPGMDTKDVVARFETERQALALMDHPNVAKVLDAGTTDSGRPYFVMELVHGVSITEFCDRNNLTARQRLEMFVDVCNAVQHAHQKGIIHRDIKPSNIMVTLHDGKPVPKVIDFGVAKATSQKLTEKTLFTAYGQMVGTPQYMSPEQAEMSGLGIDTRSDIYSLGVLLYELLTGVTPLDAERLCRSGYVEMLRLIREEEPPLPSMKISTLGTKATIVAKHRHTDAGKLSQLLRGELDWIVMKALEKDRDRRYETPHDFALDVERYLADETVEACPPTVRYRLRKYARRHRKALATGTTIGLILVVATIVSISQAIETRKALVDVQLAREGEARERNLAERQRDRAEAERDDKVAALAAEEKARRQAVELTYNMAFDRGLMLCDQGLVGRGMLWLTRALELAPLSEMEMRRVILANLNAWRRELHVLEAILPHQKAVTNAAFSPDGEMVVTGSADRTARFWDAQTGRFTGKLLMHEGDVHEIAVSPDGSRILTGNYDNTAGLWEIGTGALIQAFPHKALVPSVAFSPDGKWFVTGSSGGTVTIWDATSLEQIGELLKHQHNVHDVAISTDGSKILTACHDKNAHLWDFETRQLIASFRHETRVNTADFRRPDCSQIVTGDSDGNVYLWDVAPALADEDKTLEATAREFVGGPWQHHGGVHRLRVSLDGSRIISGSYDNTARLWNSDKQAAVGAAIDHQGAVHGVGFSPDGARVVTACGDNAARLWRLAAEQPLHTLRHRGIENHEAVFTGDVRYVLTRSDAETAVVHDAVTGVRIGVPFAQTDAVRAVAVNRDSSRFLTGGPGGTARLWNAATGELVFDPIPTGSSIWEVGFSPDGGRMLTGGFDGKVELRDARTGALLVKPLKLDGRVFQTAFSPDGSRLVVTCSDKLAYLFDANTGNMLRPLVGHQGTVVGVDFSTDGTQIVTGSFDNTARVWDAATGEPISAPMPHRGAIWQSVAFSPDGRTIVTGCDDWTVRIWDVATARPIGPVLRHEAGIRMVAFSGSSQILTGTTVGTVRRWSPSISPLEEDVERIAVWVEVATGMELDTEGTLNVLDVRNWHQRRRHLDELGGPPIERLAELPSRQTSGK